MAAAVVTAALGGVAAGGAAAWAEEAPPYVAVGASYPDDGSAPLVFSACAGLPPSPAVECASFETPLDHADPGKGDVTVAVLRAPATNPAKRIGSLIFNPGGPGGPGTQRAAFAATLPQFAALRERFDLVGFDPRGVGQSRPAVSCSEPGAALNAVAAERVREPIGPGIRRALALGRDLAAACQAANERLLPYLGTGYVAEDMDVLRRKLGEEKLTFLGFSYGTILGNVYADRYPDRVRAMALDGGMSPWQWRDKPLSLLRDNTLASEAALRRFLRWCADTPASCSFGKGDPAGAFDRLVARLDGPSVPDAGGVPQVNAAGLLHGVVGRLNRGKAGWPALAQLLTRIDSGAAVPLREVTNGDPRSDAHIAISCTDWAGTYGPRDFARYARGISAAAPRLGAFGALGPALLGITNGAVCANWPLEDAPSRHTGSYRADGSPPIVVVGTTGDPSSPYRGAVAQARNLAEGRLLTFDGEGHVAFDKSSCVNAAVVDYLITTTPPRTRHCADDVAPAAAGQP